MEDIGQFVTHQESSLTRANALVYRLALSQSECMVYTTSGLDIHFKKKVTVKIMS